MKTVASLSL